MRIFLTGASGFIGSHVMGQLLARGDEVVALSRQGRNASHLRGVDSSSLTVVSGDLLSPHGYRDAVASCEAVVHIAGWISTRKQDAERLRSLNVEATEQLWEVCREVRPKRIVYLASIFAHGRGKGTVPCDEGATYDPAILELPVPYFRAKREAELLTWRYCREHDLPMVFGYPGYCVGPGDTYLSSMRVVRDFLRGRVPAYVPGAMSFVDVRDAAAGLLGCLDQGNVGEKYLLSEHNLPWKSFFEVLGELTGRRLPMLALPTRPAQWLGRAAERISLGALVAEGDFAVMGGTWYYDGTKARRELGMPGRPLIVSLTDGVAWLRGAGMV